MSKFNLRIRELRISRKLSQQELADYLKISKSSVNMYERGEREPGLDLVEAIANFFNVDLDYLMGKTDIPQKHLFNGNKSVVLTFDGTQMTLGERIKTLRQKAGLTQEELANEIGYATKTSISKIENDVLDINQSTIVALARALKTTPSAIMGWVEPNETSVNLINKKLKKRRMELGITMKEVADIVGVSEGTISRWESGDISNMRRDKIALYAKALSVTTNFIMGIDDDSPVLSEKEIAVALAYRAHPALQLAVDKLLEIEQEEQPKKYSP